MKGIEKMDYVFGQYKVGLLRKLDNVMLCGRNDLIQECALKVVKYEDIFERKS